MKFLVLFIMLSVFPLQAKAGTCYEVSVVASSKIVNNEINLLKKKSIKTALFYTVFSMMKSPLDIIKPMAWYRAFSGNIPESKMYKKVVNGKKQNFLVTSSEGLYFQKPLRERIENLRIISNKEDFKPQYVSGYYAPLKDWLCTAAGCVLTALAPVAAKYVMGLNITDFMMLDTTIPILTLLGTGIGGLSIVANTHLREGTPEDAKYLIQKAVDFADQEETKALNEGAKQMEERVIILAVPNGLSFYGDFLKGLGYDEVEKLDK